ncbi:copper homeostasis protein CutC [Macrococcus caseolyticus]|uniref:copper homeostasis protein CutC n=1 Tax=Macrococcoides caseolyticum TaxID=69966 RepID=UPI0011AA1CB1|nr:copper homeostasis protein CutC [Macrococcus caseolyticus]MDJ1090751.1 copper homeostasis protein CutC [Macrococcus caseolyticus]MDJ1152643.1 copper homeostasis protein CutC [Macrococcus caseolyticus]
MTTYNVVETFHDLYAAVNHGATHIVINQTGMTASYGFAKIAIEYCHPLNVRVYALINPSFQSYHYTLFDVEIMREDIRQLNRMEIDGFIFGALDSDNDLDIPVMQTLIQAAESTPVIMHSQFDKIPLRAQLKAMDALIEINVSAIITHGDVSYLKPILDNTHQLGRLLRHSKGEIEIIPEVADSDEFTELKKWIPFQHAYGREIYH